MFFLRDLFFSKGQIGHNWDFTFPSYITNSFNLNNSSFYAWNSSNYGYQQHLTGAHFLPNLIYYFFSLALGVINASKLLLVVIVFFSTWSFYLFSKRHLPKITSWQRLFVSLSYAFSPFLFNEVVGGSWYMWLSYAFIPLYIHFVINLFKDKNNLKNIVGILLSSIPVITSTQNFVIVHSFLLLWIVVSYQLNKDNFIKLFAWHLNLLLANWYWIWLTIANFINLANQFTSKNFTNNFSQVRYSSQQLFEVFNLTGYLNRHFYLSSIPHKLTFLYYLTVLSVWLIGAYFLYRSKRNIKQNVFILISILSFFLVKGGNEPFSSLTMFFYEHTKFMSLYRSPQHLMLIVQFFFVVVFGFATRYLNKRLGKKIATILCLFFFLFYSSGWWYKGDLGHSKMKVAGRDYVDFFSTSSSLKDSYEIAENTATDSRHLFIPVSQSPIYIKNKNQGDNQGGVPEYTYLSSGTIFAETSPQGKKIEESICDFDTTSFNKYLLTYSIKTLTLRSDIAPTFTNCAKKWDYQKVSNFLSQNQNLELLPSSGEATNYRVRDSTPLIYQKDSSDKLIVQKASPTDYQFIATSSSNSATIVLNENFNKNWRLLDKNKLVLAESSNDQGLNSFQLNAQLISGDSYYLHFSLQDTYLFFVFATFIYIFGLVILYQIKK